MPDTKISAATDIVTVDATDMLPVARSGSTTAYRATMAEIAAFAVPPYATGIPTMDGPGAPGAAATISRGDHRHPIDTSRAPLLDAGLTGTPTAPTVTPATDSSTKLATTAFVQGAMAAAGAGVSSWNARTGAVTLTNTDVTTALTFTPYNAANPSGYQTAAQVTAAVAPYANDVGRNLLHNPLFNVAQRGAGPWTTAVYCADRWGINANNGSRSVSLSALADGDRAGIGDENAQFALLYAATGAGGAGDFEQLYQRIENLRRTSGKTVTVSFWAAPASGTPKLGVSVGQNFGSGGSPSAFVQVNGQSVTLTSGWQRYTFQFAVPSVAGKTFGTTAGSDYLQLALWFSAGSTFATASGSVGVQTATILLWGMQLEIGSVATPLEKPDPQQDLAKCQRFYVVSPAVMQGSYQPTSVPFYWTHYFPVTMRAAPSVSFANTSYLNASGLTVNVSRPGTVSLIAIMTAAGTGWASSDIIASADL